MVDRDDKLHCQDSPVDDMLSSNSRVGMSLFRAQQMLACIESRNGMKVTYVLEVVEKCGIP